MRKQRKECWRRSFEWRILILLMMFFIIAQVSKAYADTIILNNGNVVVGKITSANRQGVEIQTDYGNLSIPGSQIKKIKYEAAPQARPAPQPKASVPSASPVQPQAVTQPSIQPQVQKPTQQLQPQALQSQTPTAAQTMTPQVKQQPASPEETQTPKPAQFQQGQQKATIFLKTGEIIKGTLLAKTDKLISVKTDFGVINVKPDQVQKIAYVPAPQPQPEQKPQPQMVIIYMKTGEIVKGELVKKTSQAILIKSELGPLNINPNDVQSIEYAMAPVNTVQTKPAIHQNNIPNPMMTQNTNEHPSTQPHQAMQSHPAEQRMLSMKKAYQSYAHTGLYIGVGLGVNTPQGPDTGDPNMFSYAPAWEAKIGWDIVRYFGIEIGYEQGLGGMNNGAWTYMELPYGNLKIHLPFNDQVFSFIVGVSNAQWSMVQGDSSTLQNVLSGTSFTTTNKLSANDLAVNAGIGYDWYFSSDWSLGGELIYHYFTSVVSGTVNGGTPYTSPYSLYLSNLGLYVNVTYHINF
ncbi:MAG: hypothetical protein M1381_11905 [Deltaproteobacteria bacterium]|nr:hypothetical protein [Deltaproteobacteria bacterium]